MSSPFVDPVRLIALLAAAGVFLVAEALILAALVWGRPGGSEGAAASGAGRQTALEAVWVVAPALLLAGILFWYR